MPRLRIRRRSEELSVQTQVSGDRRDGQEGDWKEDQRGKAQEGRSEALQWQTEQEQQRKEYCGRSVRLAASEPLGRRLGRRCCDLRARGLGFRRIQQGGRQERQTRRQSGEVGRQGRRRCGQAPVDRGNRRNQESGEGRESNQSLARPTSRQASTLS